MSIALSPQSTVIATSEQVSCDLDGEAVILNLKDSIYYGLNEVGSSIWDLIQQRRTVREVRDALLQEFEVDPELCEQDVLNLLADLSQHGLVEIVDAAA